MQADQNQDVSDLIGIGPVSGSWLREIGVRTRGDLERMGSVEAFRQIQKLQTRVNLTLLWVLQAALMDLHWLKLPQEIKQQLLKELHTLPSESADA